MSCSFKHRLRKRVLKLGVFPFYMISRRGFLKQMGWFKSLHVDAPIDLGGRAIPWWSYSAILFLQSRLNNDMELFEYGSGNSTLWLAGRVKSLISVETDQGWYDALKDIVPHNVQLQYMDYDEPNGTYCRRAQESHQKFDIIIVDSRDRARCAKNSLVALKPSGVIIWDDTSNPHFLESIDYIKDAGFKSIDFIGEGPLSDAAHCTTVFYRKDNCLGI